MSKIIQGVIGLSIGLSIVILFLIVIFKVIPEIADGADQIQYLDSIQKESSYFWACMDGCYEMQMIVYNVSQFDYYDEPMKELHDECSNKCCELYMITAGCTLENISEGEK